MVVGLQIENVLLYFDAILVDLCKIWTGDAESHANTGHVTKTAIFNNSTAAAMLKIVFWRLGIYTILVMN